MKHEVLVEFVRFYKSTGIVCRNLETSSESSAYSAATFLINDRKVIFRYSKVTPAKTGQFVAIWKRNAEGVTAPYGAEDAFDFFIIAVSKDLNAGQFIFPKGVLLEQGVISNNSKGGKRSMRVYAPWDKAENKQALKTQQWQQNYFFDYNIHQAAHLHALLK